MTPPNPDPNTALPNLPTQQLRIISLNCWGLKFLSKHRHARLQEIGQQLATASPPPTIVGLQECWTQQDYLAIRARTQHILPYGKFYWSGIFGGGLAIRNRLDLRVIQAGHEYVLHVIGQIFVNRAAHRTTPLPARPRPGTG